MNRRSFLSMLAAVACAPVAKLKKLHRARRYDYLRNLGLTDRLPCALMDEAWLRAQPLTQAQALDYVAHWATNSASNARR